MSQDSDGPFQGIAKKMELTEEARRATASLVLLNPDLLTTQYKNSKTLASEGEAYAKKGNLPVARSRFASASKLALYEGDPDSAKKYLQKAVSIDETYPGIGSALSDFDSVSKAVIEFYRDKYSSPSKK